MKTLLTVALGLAYLAAPVNAEEISIEVPQKVVTVAEKTEFKHVNMNIRFGMNDKAESLLGFGVSKEFDLGRLSTEIEANMDFGIYKEEDGLTRLAPKVSIGTEQHRVFLQYNLQKNSEFGTGYTFRF